MKILRPLLSLGAFLLTSFFSGCATSEYTSSYYHPEFLASIPVSLSARVSEIEKLDFDNLHLETITQDVLSSHHLVVIRKAEPLHQHVEHDVWALVVKGEADFILGEKKMRLRPGSSVFVPRLTPHKATRRGKEVLAAFAIFTPPFDGKDTVRLEEK